MDSIAEVMTAEEIVYFRFNDEDKTMVKRVEAELGDLADQGLVFSLEFHTIQ